MRAEQEGKSWIPLYGCLGALFVLLKFFGVLSWPWWIILTPFWFPVALMIFCISVVIIVDFIN